MVSDTSLEWLTSDQKILLIFILTIVFYVLTIKLYVQINPYDPTARTTILLSAIYGSIAFITINVGSILINFLIFANISHSIAETMTVSPIRIVLVTPLLEEMVKGIVFLLLLKQRPQSVDTPLDGLIIGALIGSSFGFWESLLFGMRAVNSISIIGAINLTFLRGLFLVVGHPLFTGIFGMGIAYRRIGLNVHPFRYFVNGVILHYIWNFLVVIRLFIPSIPILVYLSLLFFDFVMSISYLFVLIFSGLDIERKLVEKGYYQRKRKYFIT